MISSRARVWFGSRRVGRRVGLHRDFTAEDLKTPTDGGAVDNHAEHETTGIAHGFTGWFEREDAQKFCTYLQPAVSYK